MPRLVQLLIILSISTMLTAQERDLQWVLSRYLEAAGGRVNLKELNSVVVEGTLTVPDQSPIAIKVMKKRPDYVRQLMDFNDGRRVILGYNGEKAWQLSSDRRQENFTYLDPEQAISFVREAGLENPLASSNFDKSLLSYKGVTEIEDLIECHLISVSYPDGTVSDFYIDTRTFLERKSVKNEKNADGSVSKTVSFPSEFQFFNGVLFAQRVVIQRDNGSSSILTIDKVRINPGVPVSLFNPPPNY